MAETTVPKKVTQIFQEDPLYTVRPRYLRDQADSGSRGTRAKFTLLSFLKTTKEFKETSKDFMSSKIRERLLGKGEGPYTDFLITGLSYSFQEKIQLQPLFGDKTAAFAFGAAPVILQIQGVVTDDLDNNWFYKLMLLYRDHLRGTKLARNFELAQLSTNNAIFTGVIMSLGISQESSNDSIVAFNMQFLVRGVTYLSAYQNISVLDTSVERMIETTTDGTFTYAELRDNKALKLKELADSAGVPINSSTVETITGFKVTTETGYRSDKDAVLHATQSGSLTGLASFLEGLKNTPISKAGKITAFESFLAKASNTNAGGATLSILGTYGNFISTLNTEYIGGFGDFVGEIQRNVEAFNRVIGYVGVSELVDTAANVRNQINRMNNLVNTVKDSYNNLKNLKNVFNDLKGEFDNIEKAWKNLRGSVSNFNESTSDRLKRSMRSSSADIPAVLGNTALGISKEEAAAILGISSTSSSNPLDALITGAGQNTSVEDIVASISSRTGLTEAQAEATLLATFSTKAPDKAVIPNDKPTAIGSSTGSAILVF